MVDLQYLKRSTLSDFLCVHRALPVCSPCVHSPFTVGSQSVYIALTIYSVFTYCACIQRSISHQRHHFNNNLCTPKNNPEVLRINRSSCFQKTFKYRSPFTLHTVCAQRSLIVLSPLPFTKVLSLFPQSAFQWESIAFQGLIFGEREGERKGERERELRERGRAIEREKDKVQHILIY